MKFCEIMEDVVKKGIEMDKEPNKNVAWWQPGMELFLRLSGWIGGPVIIAVFVGKYLDRKYGTAPWLFLGCVGVSFVISMIALIYIGFGEIKKINKDSENSKKSEARNQKSETNSNDKNLNDKNGLGF